MAFRILGVFRVHRVFRILRVKHQEACEWLWPIANVLLYSTLKLQWKFAISIICIGTNRFVVDLGTGTLVVGTGKWSLLCR